PLRLPGVIFFCISDTLVPTTYLVDTTLSDASDYDQTVHAVRLQLITYQWVLCQQAMGYASTSYGKEVKFSSQLSTCG
ncbi:hypothetical protein, partial [Klebsiella variicola]|uniref:hypothetical protein n=1 Tax=Klebsiella variicola TaxID=244366 RepID=UPI002B0621D1